MKNLIKKIWNWIVGIPQDKLLHMDAGELINLYAFALVFRITGLWWGLLIAWVVATAFLIGKEVYDYKHKEQGHSVEIGDIVWGEVGILLIDLALIIALC